MRVEGVLAKKKGGMTGRASSSRRITEIILVMILVSFIREIQLLSLNHGELVLCLDIMPQTVKLISFCCKMRQI